MVTLNLHINSIHLSAPLTKENITYYLFDIKAKMVIVGNCLALEVKYIKKTEQ